MNKKLIVILTLSLTVFLMISTVNAGVFDIFGGGSDTSNNDNTFIVGFNGDFPPFGYKDSNGEYTGFDIELAKEVCRRNNWTFKAQPIIDWNTKEVELNSNAIDCIWSEFTIDGREDAYTWSNPYFNNSQVIVVKSDSGIDSLDDLKGKVLEVQQGNSVLQAIEENETLKNTFEKINQVDTYNTAFTDLDSGVCDAVIADSGIANYLAVEKYPKTKVLDEILSYEKYGVGFKKGNDELRNQVQKTLDEMFKDGTVDEIAQNYSAYKIPEGLIYPQN